MTVGKISQGTWLCIALIVLSASPAPPPARAQGKGAGVSVEVKKTLRALISDEDTDNDTRITVEDPHVPGTTRGDKRFWVEASGGERFEVRGTYYLSNLLQELKFAEEAGLDTLRLDPTRIFEGPVDRLSRMIRDHYWDGLTRRIDERGLLKILSDEKTTPRDGFTTLYVPGDDTTACLYYEAIARGHPAERIKVVRLPLPERISGEFQRALEGHHGLLTLEIRPAPGGTYEGVPFVVPGGRFNEMYGWDSYFITLGLLQDGRTDLAKSMVDNLVYEIRHYGKILNANRTYYLTRSQPPFLTSMIRAVARALPPDDATHRWLRDAVEAAIEEYSTVWMGKDHLTAIGLSRYRDSGAGPSPEVEAGHFDAVYASFARTRGMDPASFERAYTTGTLKAPELDDYFVHDRAMRESGHDTSERLIGICADLVTVDLNSLLYRIERDIGDIIREEFGDSFSGGGRGKQTSAVWYARAERRKDLMNRYLWNPDRGMFFDYDVVRGRQRPYVSATTFYPLWAGSATEEQASALARKALPLLESPGGLAASDEESRGPLSDAHPQRQWDYPYGWAPHQMLAWQGFLNYRNDAVAHRLIYRWLYTIAANAADYDGTIPEKFDVVQRSHRVFAEYGNVGTDFAYITREGFGWTNASYEVGLALLPPRLREDLTRLIPPEWVFHR